MSTELIKSIPTSNIPGLTPVQKGWLRLADLKVVISEKLTKGELEIQSLLNQIADEKDLAKVQEAIKKAKSIAAENKDARLYITNMIKEKLTEPLMEYERRNDELICGAGDHELALRKEANKTAQADKEKEREVAQLKAHIHNEYLRIGANYRSRLNKLLNDAYTQALKDKVPLDTIPGYIDQIHNFMVAEKLDKFVKFERRYVSDEDAAAIFKAIEPYKSGDDLKAALARLREHFSMYANDLKNSKKAIQAENERIQKEQKEEEERIERETATNTLVAQADTYSGITNPDAPKTDVKVQYELVEENTDEWLFGVLAAFMGNMQAVKEYIKVKTPGKLTVAQMGAAIAKLHSKTGKKFSGLNFQKIEK